MISYRLSLLKKINEHVKTAHYMYNSNVQLNFKYWNNIVQSCQYFDLKSRLFIVSKNTDKLVKKAFEFPVES